MQFESEITDYGGRFMGWSFRKTFKLGPINLNLSKSGLGVSSGMKGARVSTGPRGTQFSAGKYGIRYTKNLGGKGKAGVGLGLVSVVGMLVYWFTHSAK